MTKHRTENAVNPFEVRDDTLLYEGKYREWFYKGMEKKARDWLAVPAKILSPPPAEPVFKNQEFPQVKRWRDNASCRGASSVVFFGDEGTDLKKEYMKPDAAWRQFCPDCPVKDLCLELARKSKSVGIFGGMLFVHQNVTEAVGQREFDESSMPRRGRPRKKVYPRACSVNRHVLMSEDDLDGNGECRQCGGDYSIRS